MDGSTTPKSNYRAKSRENPQKGCERLIVLFDHVKQCEDATEILYSKDRFEGEKMGGYSFAFWIQFASLTKDSKRIRSIMTLIRDGVHAEFALYLQGNSLLIETNTQGKTQRIFSEKSLVPEVLYHICIVVEMSEEISDISLFINGNHDAEGSLLQYDPFNEADLQLGVYRTYCSFRGIITEFIVFYEGIGDEQIKRMYSEGKMQLRKTGSLQTSQEIFEKAENSEAQHNFSKSTMIPDHVVQSLDLDKRMAEREEIIEETENIGGGEDMDVYEKLNDLFDKAPHLEGICSDIAINHDWIFTTMSAMTSGNTDKFATIELPRFMLVMKELGVMIIPNEVYQLAKLMACELEEPNKFSITFYEFLKPLRVRFCPPPPTHDSNQSPRGRKDEKDESLAPAEGEEGGQPPEDEDMPQLLDTWNEGTFDINIDRCSDCYMHQGNTRHTEDMFIDEFNRLGDELKGVFENINIIGNEEKIAKLGGFEVYVRGVGPLPKRNAAGKFFLFKKTTEFGDIQLILDKLILLVMCYGSSRDLGRAQKQFRLKNKHLIPKRYQNMHAHPCEMPDTIPKQRTIRNIVDMDDIPMVCQHWGCGQDYESGNNRIECTFHPGRYEFGSAHGLWPEGWTCCRGGWDTAGCTFGQHRGVMREKQLFLCVNHGEINPRRGYPDSFCGRPFGKKGPDGCAIHPGHIQLNSETNALSWSCCDGEAGPDTPACKKQNHRAAIYPEEEAKIYFYNKPNKNPGAKSSPTRTPTGKSQAQLEILQFRKLGRFSGYFKEVKDYEMVGKVPVHITKEEQDKIDKIERYCLRWACETIYTEEKNKVRKRCRYHPGKWDFGHTGVSLKHVMNDMSQNALLWKPHWTCCRKEWEAPGCEMGHHRGIQVSKMTKATRMFKWPDPRLQIYFRKAVSASWRERLEKEVFDEKRADFAFRDFVELRGYGGKLPMSELPDLLDKFKLHLFVISDDITYHFKYLDVVEMRANQILDDGRGNIDKEKFMSWWFAPIEVLLGLDTEQDSEDPNDKQS